LNGLPEADFSALAANLHIVQHTDVSAAKMLRCARMAAMTGRTAAYSSGDHGLQWAGCDLRPCMTAKLKYMFSAHSSGSPWTSNRHYIFFLRVLRGVYIGQQTA